MMAGYSRRIVMLAALGAVVMAGAPVSTYAGSAGPDGTDDPAGGSGKTVSGAGVVPENIGPCGVAGAGDSGGCRAL